MNILTNHIQLAINASKYINDSSKEYSLYVAETRGIPSVWDGLKDGQRKALYLLQKRSGEIKTISLAGEMISSGLYVHGDIAAAESVGKLAAPYLNNLPLIKGIGNFGTRIKPGEIAAPRYTYVKKNNVTETIIYPDADIAPMMPNYDDSTYSPQHYLPLIPTVLLNGISGMAPGFSTDILPRNITDLIDATYDVLNLKMPKTLSPKYDYCSGDVENLGPNKWAFYGKCDVVDSSTVHVKELCPGMTHESFIEKLEAMIDSKAIRNYDDNTKDIIDIVIRLDRHGAMAYDPDMDMKVLWTNKQACEYFSLVFRTTERIVVVDWDGKTIKPYDSPEELLIHFVQHRFKYFVKRYEKLKDDAEHALTFWRLLKMCYDDNLPAKLKNIKNKAELVGLIDGIAKANNHTVDEDQIDRIASLPTYRWAKDEYQRVLDEIQDYEEKIEGYNEVLSDDENIWDIYRQEVKALKKVKFDIER